MKRLRDIRILGLTPPANDRRDAVDQMLDRDIHDSEGLRALVLAIALALFLAAYVWACFTRPELIGQLPTRPQRLAVGFSLAIALLVAGLTKPASVLLKRANRPPPLGGRLISAFLETSLPTAILLAVATQRRSGDLELLGLPPTWFYFPLIILSILRLDRNISYFTGLVAGLEYRALAIWLLHGATAAERAAARPHEYTVKAIVLVLSGVLAGEVTSRVREWIRKSNAINARFGQFVSPTVAARLIEQKELDSEVRHVCVMFLDIRDFTSFSEKRGPQEVVLYLNTLFGFMIDAVNVNNGIINKFLGDGFMAVFGAPLSDGKDARNALAAAQQIIGQVNDLVARGTIPATRIGIGLHTGPAVTGVIGTATRGEYTVIGDVVNLASRIESLNKEFGSCLLVSDEVLAAVGDRPRNAVGRGPVKVKGREAPVQLYQLA